MQAATDVFLGWTQNPVNGRYFYVRRLKDHDWPISEPASKQSCRTTPRSAAVPWHALMRGLAMRWHCRAIWAMTASSTKRSQNSRWLTPTRQSVTGVRLLDAIKAGRITAEDSTFRQLDTVRARPNSRQSTAGSPKASERQRQRCERAVRGTRCDAYRVGDKVRLWRLAAKPGSRFGRMIPQLARRSTSVRSSRDTNTPAANSSGEAFARSFLGCRRVVAQISAATGSTLIEEGSGRILGVHLVGPNADELINLFGIAIRHDLTADDLRSTMFAYPTGASDSRASPRAPARRRRTTAASVFTRP